MALTFPVEPDEEVFEPPQAVRSDAASSNTPVPSATDFVIPVIAAHGKS